MISRSSMWRLKTTTSVFINYSHCGTQNIGLIDSVLELKLSVFDDDYLCSKEEVVLAKTITGSEYMASICFCGMGLTFCNSMDILEKRKIYLESSGNLAVII
jgi:hypothetical protein